MLGNLTFIILVATSITANNVTTEAAETIELLNSAINVTGEFVI